MKYLIFDTETSGLPNRNLPPSHPSQPYLLQLAAILLDEEGSEIGSLDCLIRQPKTVKIHEGAMRAHGISWERCDQDGIHPAEAYIRFMMLSDQATDLIAYNVDFDILLMQALAYRLKAKDLTQDKDIFCVMRAMTPICKIPGYYDEFKWPKLAEAYRHVMGTDFERAHDALADVRATAVVWKWLKAQRADSGL